MFLTVKFKTADYLWKSQLQTDLKDAEEKIKRKSRELRLYRYNLYLHECCTKKQEKQYARAVFSRVLFRWHVKLLWLRVKKHSVTDVFFIHSWLAQSEVSTRLASPVFSTLFPGSLSKEQYVFN